MADYTQGIGWLTDWVNGAPKYGWADTGAYLVLPVLLVLSQYASMELLTPKSTDPQQQQSQAILKFLPLMIGWFSLSVPSGLGLYWLTNNVLTTATTLLIRQMTPTLEIQIPGGGAAAAVDPASTKGFGGRRFGEIIESTSDSGAKIKIKPPGAGVGDLSTTASEASMQVIDAEVLDQESEEVGEDSNKKSKKKKKKRF